MCSPPRQQQQRSPRRSAPATNTCPVHDRATAAAHHRTHPRRAAASWCTARGEGEHGTAVSARLSSSPAPRWPLLLLLRARDAKVRPDAYRRAWRRSAPATAGLYPWPPGTLTLTGVPSMVEQRAHAMHAGARREGGQSEVGRCPSVGCLCARQMPPIHAVRRYAVADRCP